MSILLDNISFSYKNKSIFKDFSLTINTSKCTAITGKNGTGKTTLGQLIMGMLKPDIGNITFCNEPIGTLSEMGSKIGYLFQNPSKQIFALTVKEDIVFPLQMNKEEDIDEKYQKVESMFHLEGLQNRKTHLLSQGEKQRVALASIFIREPLYLILDEPTTGLDVVRKKILGELIQDIKSKGIGILLISHDKKFVKEHADCCLEMEHICN